MPGLFIHFIDPSFYANIILSWLLQHLVIVVQSLSRV